MGFLVFYPHNVTANVVDRRSLYSSFDGNVAILPDVIWIH